MSSITLKDKTFVPFLEEAILLKAIKRMALQINADYEDETPLFLGVLNGSFMFLGDLLKEITLSTTVSFVKMASYAGVQSTGSVNELIGLNENLAGRDVIIVEDIVDTGNTLEKLYAILADKGINSIKTATLLYKPDVYNKKIAIDYVGIEIPNRFVVGYGLDYDGLGRNLSSLFILKD